MLEEFVLDLAVTAIGAAVLSTITWLRNLWVKVTLPLSVRAKLSKTDIQKAVETRALINDCFHDGLVYSMAHRANIDRVALVVDLAKKLASQYGLNIEIDFLYKNDPTMGGYNWADKKMRFDVTLLLVDENDPGFEAAMRETIDTIVHELRHAVQHKAICEPGFWNVEDARRAAWLKNLRKYIDPRADLKRYLKQPIERDAYTFASTVMEGVN